MRMIIVELLVIQGGADNHDAWVTTAYDISQICLLLRLTSLMCGSLVYVE